MKKKFLSLIMALAMVLSLAVPAFAETTTSGEGITGSNAVTATTDFGAVTATPTVDVTLPTGGVSDSGSERHVLINPYRLAYTRSGAEGSVDGEGLNQTNAGATNPQVISAPLEITNKTNAPMKIGMTVKATPANTDVKIAAKTMTGKETDKSVFLFAELYYAGTTRKSTSTAWAGTEWTAEADFGNAAKLNEKCFPQVIATEAGKTNEITELVPAASSSAANYIYFKVLGTAASNPTKAWTSSDTVAVQIVFTFTPVSPYTVHCFKSDGTSNATTADYTVRNGSGTPMVTTAVMNMPVWIKADYNSSTQKYGAVTSVTVTDMDGANPVTATKVDDTLWWFKMPAYEVKLAVSSTAAPTS